MDTCLRGAGDGDTCICASDIETCLGAGDCERCLGAGVNDMCLGASDGETCLGAWVVTCLGAGDSSLSCSLSRRSRCSLTMVSMGTPTPMSRLSGSKSAGGSTGSLYGASKSSMGRQGLSKPSLSGVEPPLRTRSESSASQTCRRKCNQ